MRKIIGLVIVLILVLAAQVSFAAEETPVDDFLWDGTTITKYIGTDLNVIIPSKCTSIGAYAFGIEPTSPDDRGGVNANSNITSVFIPNSVESIEYSAFFGCSSLTSVNIPSSVTSISPSAFQYCSSIRNIIIPNNVTSIGERTFFGCTSLISIVVLGKSQEQANALLENANLPSGCSIITEAPESDFEWDGTVITKYIGTETDVVIPSKCTSIGDAAFYENTSLLTITITNNVTSIGNEAFLNCTNLTRVEIPQSVTNIGSEAFSSTSWLDNYINEFVIVGNDILLKYKGEGTNVVIPYNVKVIGANAFRYYTSIQTVIIPETVIKIDYSAFEGCSSLVSIIIPNSVMDIEDGAFSSCTSLADIVIPQTVEYIGGFAFDGTPWLENYPGDFVIVGDNILIKYQGNQTSLSVPSNVKVIGNYSFSSCSFITEISIPESVTNIGKSAFSRCYNLNNITLPNSITIIGERAFSNCGLTSITIPSSIENISENAFYQCSSLESVKMEDGVKAIEDYAFNYCGNLKSVIFSNQLIRIGKGSFANCRNLTSVTIPGSVISIGRSAFTSYNSLLTSVYIKNKTQIQADILLLNANLPTGCNIYVLGITGTKLENNILNSAEIISNSSMPETADIVAVLYDPSTKKIEATEIVKDVELSRDGSAQTINFNGKITYSPGKIIKVFVWDRIGGLTPLMDSYEYTGI